MRLWNEFIMIVMNISWLAALCFIVGFILTITEMVMPGLHVPGIIGFCLLILGVIFASNSLSQAVILSVLVLVILVIALLIVIRSASKGRLSKTPVILRDANSQAKGYVAGQNFADLLGKIGTAVSILRPAGIGDFEGKRVDVVTRGEFIAQGDGIKVIDVVGHTVIVEKGMQ